MCLNKHPCPWARQLSTLSKMILKAWASFEGFLHSLTLCVFLEKKKKKSTQAKKQEPVDPREIKHFIPTVEPPNSMQTGIEN